MSSDSIFQLLLNPVTLWVLLVILCCCVWYIWRSYSTLKQHNALSRILKVILNGLSNYCEVLLFDEIGKTLWTTHPNTYSSQEEFWRKIVERTAPSPKIAELKRLLETKNSGALLLESNLHQTNRKPQHLLVRVAPAEIAEGRIGILVTVTDLGHHLEGYEALKKDYQRLEQFLDNAPIGLLYQDKDGFILAGNQTVVEWLGKPRELVIGARLSEFLQKDGESLGVLKAKGISAGLKVLVTPYSSLPPQALLLTKIEHNVSTSFELPNYAHAPIPTAIVSTEGTLLQWNPAFLSMIGDKFTLKLYQTLDPLLHPAVRSEVMIKLRHIVDNPKAAATFEMRFKDDMLHTTTYISALPVKKRGDSAAVLMQFIDISEQKRLESQFIQSQKMQAVGQLAGGIAHDFNNLLTAMIGYSDLLLQRCLPHDPSYNDIIQIKQNAARAANLVRQLLAFSRQQTLQPKVLNIIDTLTELSMLLHRLIGANIELRFHHERELWLVKVDPSQLEQVIINMAVNARDAMQQTGILTISTKNVLISLPQRTGDDILIPGEYVMIEVKDTGSGVAPEHLEHIFEPFFSTKEVGSGTGLGLSMAYGIVKQTGGVITVESKIGIGTTFKIYLPRYQGAEEAAPHEKEVISGDLTGQDTILLVEDEDAVRMFSARALREKGYQVVEAPSGEKAIEFLEKGHNFNLLITDVVMPKIDGPTLSKRFHDFLPKSKTIFISGYTEDTFRKSIDNNTHIHFLQKPFTLKELAAKVKEVLANEEV